MPSSALFVSAVSVGEIQTGIEITRGRDPTRAAEIEQWLERIIQTFQICDFDAASSQIWAKLVQKTTADHVLDAMIAAIAIARGMTVATRNVRHFKSFGVGVLNPFAAT